MNKGISLTDVDGALLTANGNLYGTPPDVASYIRYVFGGKDLSTFLRVASNEDLDDAHVLMAAKVMDGSLCLRDNEHGALLIGFCANRVAKKLTEVSGKEHRAFVVA